MKLIKKINNNFAVARDSAGQCVIVSGRGIGFEKMPSELHDISKITRTYYDVDERYINLVKQLPEEIVQLSTKIVDYASNKLQQKLNPNLFFTLADHINFAIKRAEKGIEFKFGITYEMKYLYSEEMEIGNKVVNLLNKKFHIHMPEAESAIIAMHILEAESFSNKAVSNEVNMNHLLKGICEILHDVLGLQVDKNSFNYCRFVTHVQYLLERRGNEHEITSDNTSIFRMMMQEFPDIYHCVQEIQTYLIEQLTWDISEEEMLYLMLHINRLCNKEDCNQ